MTGSQFLIFGERSQYGIGKDLLEMKGVSIYTRTRRTATPVTVRTMSGFSTPRTQDSVESVDPAHSKINPGSYCARKQGFILRERLGGEGKALLTAERQLLNIKGMIKKVTLLPSWQ